VLFTFDEPLACRQLTVQTGDPVNQFYGITDGHVEVLYEGKDQFVWNTPKFDMYNRVVLPQWVFSAGKVKAVKIVVDGPGEDKAVSIQPLIIE
jgi:hypothetical protein